MQKKKLLHRLISICLALNLLIGLGTNVFVSKAAEISKVTKTYDIAVVFDNSGSMYDNKAWCRAKYAMEIFASMLNYENGDTLTIFPMWEVTTDGKTKKGGSYKPITIDSLAGIEKISALYTTNPSSTPFEPITEAHEYLKKSDSGKEKWLIVLTDGAFNQNKRGKQASIDLQKKLSSLASKNIKVQYLGFGNATKLDSKPGKGFYAKKSTDESLKDDLIVICNTIFQRAELPDDCLNGSTLELDLSMRKLVVFAQGKGAKITSLKDSTGKSIAITLDSGQRKFSKITAAGKYENAPVDETLYGQVVTFDSCSKGTYTLGCSGADAVQIFYEPDVDIGIRLENSDGQEVDLSEGKITADNYKIYYGIVDNVTGEDVTDSALMGEDVFLSGAQIDETGKESELKNGGDVALKAGEKIYFRISGTYLEDYTITTDDNKDAFTFVIEAPPTDTMTLNAMVQQADEWYTLSEHDKWKPIRVELKYNGANLTDEQLNQVEWNVEVDKPLEWKMELLPGESAANIYIGTNKDGQYVAPGIDKYAMEIWASVKDEYGQDVKSQTDKVSFKVQTYSLLVKWLIRLAILLAILALILFIMSRKAMPKGMVVERINFQLMGRTIPGGGEASYDRKGKMLSIDSIPVPNKMAAEIHVSFNLIPIDRRWTASKKRRVGIVGINVLDMGSDRVNIDGAKFEKNKDGMFVPTGAKNDPIDEKVRNPIIKVYTKQSQIECSMINR